MAILAPFRGIYYNQSKIKDIALVVAPPYDVITSEEQEKYYERHPYNIIRLILGKSLPQDDGCNNKYTRANQYYETWKKEEVLVQDDFPGLYYCEQEFEIKGSQRRKRKGFIALIKLEDFASGVILPHEKTMTGPKSDRLNLMEACHANLSPIFSLYSDSEKNIERILDANKPPHPFFDFYDDSNTRNQLWKIHDKDVISDVSKRVENMSLFIADGHHRYETALDYVMRMQKKNNSPCGNEAYRFVMMYLSNTCDDGMVILPTHRLLRGFDTFDRTRFLERAKQYFHVEEFLFDSGNELQVRKELFVQLEKRGQEQPTFGMYGKGGRAYHLLALKNESLENLEAMEDVPPVTRRLDVNILQSFILNNIFGISENNMESQKNVYFLKDGDKAIESVQRGEYQLAFLMNPTKIDQVSQAAHARVRLPQKSTFFYPKILSGLLLNSIQVK